MLGTYDPVPKATPYGEEDSKPIKDIKLDTSRAKYWLGVGAQPSEPVWRLLSMVSRAVCGLWCFLGGVVEEEGERRKIVEKRSRRSGLTRWIIDRVIGAEI